MDQRWVWIGVLALAGLAAVAYGSHYERLGLPLNATEDEILAAYRQLSASWRTDELYNQSEIEKIIQVEHAYQLLSNKETRRDYDYFNIDDLQEDVLQAVKQYEGEGQLVEIRLPILVSKIFGNKIFSTANALTIGNFGELVMESSDPWLIQIYSDVNPDSRRFSSVWDKIVELLEGVVRVGRLELSELQLGLILAERNWLNGYPFFRNGLPAIIAVPPLCNKLECIKRYYGEKTAEAITDWMGSRLLRLPRIIYHNAQSLMTNIIQKSGPEKVKVIGFSYTGERAAAYLRRAAKDYWEYAVFAMVLWRESEASFWETKIGVERAPALVILKDPGLMPVIYHGKLNSSTFIGVMEQHKSHELPQLRSISATNLGCDASGYSLAGNDTRTWYCVIVAGKTGPALSEMRIVLRGVQEQLKLGRGNHLSATVAVEAYRQKRLRLAWLDGEIQKDFCYFYLNSESMFEACGPRKYEIEELPKIFLIRYLREVEQSEGEAQEKRWLPKTRWERQAEEEKQYARQLVTKYNGSSDVAEIVAWISNMVYQGDSQELPSFRGRAPDLAPEESAPFATKTQEFILEKKEEIFEKGQNFLYMLQDLRDDAKFTPFVLIIAVVYTSAWLLSTRYKVTPASAVSTDVATGNLNDEADQAPVKELVSNETVGVQERGIASVRRRNESESVQKRS
ncbi:hypothetical protein R1flu_009594 [Riccia fluitans]|uniref:J domain-containing protein n=1 Tax=Riccia fluitans TaxID=41844 RepID=A0ABD1Z5K1_9MARC